MRDHQVAVVGLRKLLELGQVLARELDALLKAAQRIVFELRVVRVMEAGRGSGGWIQAEVVIEVAVDKRAEIRFGGYSGGCEGKKQSKLHAFHCRVGLLQ